MTDGSGDVYGRDSLLLQTYHLPKLPVCDQINRSDSETGCQHTIKRSGRSTPLDVAKHADSHFFVRAERDGVPNQVSHRASARHVQQFAGQPHTFGHDNDGEVLAVTFTLQHAAAKILD